MFELKFNLHSEIIEIDKDNYLLAIVDDNDNVFYYNYFSTNEDAETAADLVKEILTPFFSANRHPCRKANLLKKNS